MTHTLELEFDQDDFYIYTHNGAPIARVLEFVDFPCADSKDEQDIRDAQVAVGHLLAAAYNSYDKHFGPRAVEAAEADLLGEAMGVMRSLDEYAGDSCAIEMLILGEIIASARALLSKSKGVGN